ncbi:MAG TPA: DUF2156 domain-containing protein [Gemmatimonadaceae bacterium]|nr:DUF2156 domain-containing protein [Gemmatimonadaceae bacterium]
MLRHGWNATAYQILNPGIRLWFAARGDAVVGYVPARGVRVVAGAPVCSAERLDEVAAEFERDARLPGRRVCYFGAGHRLEATLAASPERGPGRAAERATGSAAVLLGAQPVWRPAEFAEIVRGHSSLRAQLARARNKGVTVEEWPTALAHRHPALERCLAEWLSTRGLPPLHFLVEPDTLGRLWDRRVFVAMRGGAPVAFLVASPVPARDGWLVEQIVRGRASPNGTSELLIAHAMDAVAAAGAAWATLGLAPLSRRADIRAPAPAPWLRLTLRLVRAHGRRFYDFDGLDAFKAKLRPQWWEPIYAVTREPSFSPRMLAAVAAAFSGGSPFALVARAVWRGAAQEVRWLRKSRV